jgi:hypothetical protein
MPELNARHSTEVSHINFRVDSRTNPWKERAIWNTAELGFIRFRMESGIRSRASCLWFRLPRNGCLLHSVGPVGAFSGRKTH